MNNTQQLPDSQASLANSDRDALGRIGVDDVPWPARPWVMALIGAVTGLLIWFCGETWSDALGEQLAASLIAGLLIGATSFVLSVEERRWHWSALFSLFWGVIGGLVFWQVMGSNGGREPFAWPFVSVVLAILIATPFFQAKRDEVDGSSQWRIWQLPYARLHDHAWIDAVLGAAAMVFIGLCFAMLALIGGLFSLIGIEFVSKLFDRGWFMMALAGAAFGAAVGMLRERDRLVSVLQRLVMIILSVLAPILAAALVVFLGSLPFTGLGKLWNSGFSAAYLLLAVAAASLLLANSVIGNAKAELSKNRLMRASAAVLAVPVLPLAVLAAIAIGLRIDQYGWTPSRIWGVIAVGVAVAYGLAGLMSVLRGRWDFAEALRDAQKKLAVAVLALAFFLALPILDFGAISTRDQLARLNSGAVSVKDFDWAAMALQFGPRGRDALADVAKNGPADQAKAAKAALKAKNRWDVRGDVVEAQSAPLEQRLRLVPQDATLPDGLREKIASRYVCGVASACSAVQVNPQLWAVKVQNEEGGSVSTRWFTAREQGWIEDGAVAGAMPPAAVENSKRGPLLDAKIEVREVKLRQIYIDGQPSGGVFE